MVFPVNVPPSVKCTILYFSLFSGPDAPWQLFIASQDPENEFRANFFFLKSDHFVLVRHGHMDEKTKTQCHRREADQIAPCPGAAMRGGNYGQGG